VCSLGLHRQIASQIEGPAERTMLLVYALPAAGYMLGKEGSDTL
jgi:hypothetical protein